MLSETCGAALPRVVTLDDCDFPIVEEEAPGYGTVLKLPDELRKAFEEGAHAVRINSLELANRLPDYGGRTTGTSHSLLPHQDHGHPFLMLSKLEGGERGAQTLLMLPAVAAKMLPTIEAYITDRSRRRIAAAQRAYDQRFQMTEPQYDRCFDVDGGYQRVMAELLAETKGKETELTVRLNTLGYLIRGPLADIAMRELDQRHPGSFVEERWETAGVFIIRNKPGTYHARRGGSEQLKRNFCR